MVHLTVTRGTSLNKTRKVFVATRGNARGARGEAGSLPVLNTLPDEPTILGTDIGLVEKTNGTQKKFTFDNLIVYCKAQLTGFFLKLAGVDGGQTLNGGTESGDPLNVQSNPFNDGPINFNSKVSFDENGRLIILIGEDAGIAFSDSHFYEVAPGVVTYAAGGVDAWHINILWFGSATLGGPFLLNEVSGPLNPTLIANNEYTANGIGSDANGLYGIVNGIMAWTADNDGNISGTGTASNLQTGTAYELVLTDAGKLITFDNAAAIALTIPANVAVAFKVGTVINLLQLGAGQVTVGITTDTLDSSDAKVALTGQYSAATLYKKTATTWVLFGDLA